MFCMDDGIVPLKNQKTAQPQYDRTLIGYARVSTQEQNLDLQVEALKRAGVSPTVIYTEKVSGVSAKRPVRDLAVRQCREGDTFVVWRLDRVGRSAVDLLQFVQMLDDEGIKFKSLQDSAIDTTTPMGKLVLSVMAAVAQLERDIIQERTKAGVAAAKARGVKFGQPPIITAKHEVEIERMLGEGMSVKDIAEHYDVVQQTIRRRFPLARLNAARAKGARKRKGKKA